jgi:hypothetical protein
MLMSSRLLMRALPMVAIALATAESGVAGQTAAEPPAAFGDPYTEAAGLRPLRLQAVPDGTREMRVWVGGGLGWPQALYRLTERGGRASGEYIRYWLLDNHDPVGADSATFAALMRYHERGRCELVPVGRFAEACRAIFQREPDWGAVWRVADSLGVWTLPDASTLPEVVGPHGERTVTLDGWGITVELRDATSYRTWHYGNPDTKPWPEAARATAFAAALRRVSALLRRSAAEHVYTGRVDVRADTLEFTPCAGGGPWLLQAHDPRLVDPHGAAGPAVPSRRVDVRATLTPDWLARDWWHVPLHFQRTLEVDSVLAITPWVPRECASSSTRTP